MTDEELEPFLSGNQGVAALDLARELVGTRVLLAQAQTAAEAALASALTYAAVADMHQATAAGARAKLAEMKDTMANLSASLHEFLEEPGDKDDD